MKIPTCPRRLLFCLALALVAGHCRGVVADVKLPAIFADHMVLQRDAAVPVWGWADPGEQVTVSLAGQVRTATAGADGKWAVKLDKLPAGGPLTLSVKGGSTITVSDVLVGEVWLGSGQSNMNLRVSAVNHYEEERQAANLPQIRMFTVSTQYASAPEPDCRGQWQVCSPETVGNFSATAYFFGCELHKKLGLSVGLIHSSVGGTPIESWISKEAQEKMPELKPFLAMRDKTVGQFDAKAAEAQYQKALARWKEQSRKKGAAGKTARPRAPRNQAELFLRKNDLGGLFNGMIAPLIPYSIRGAIWYQGEANSVSAKAPFYQIQLPLLVRDWRARWGEGDFPFAWVQLPNFISPERNFPLVREAMLKSLEASNTGMAVTIDIGDPKNIHPKNKQDVGKRLAAWALNRVYGLEVVPSGPIYRSMEKHSRSIVLHFENANGLTAKGGAPKGFTIAGADRKFLPAQARIVGETIEVTRPDVADPAAVRYGWADNPECNLYNAAGLPASPFRTDDWPIDGQD